MNTDYLEGLLFMQMIEIPGGWHLDSWEVRLFTWRSRYSLGRNEGGKEGSEDLYVNIFLTASFHNFILKILLLYVYKNNTDIESNFPSSHTKCTWIMIILYVIIYIKANAIWNHFLQHFKERRYSIFFYKWSYQLIQAQKEACIQTLEYFIINRQFPKTASKVDWLLP